MNRQLRNKLILLLVVLVIGIVPNVVTPMPGAVTPAKAGCSWGDLICELQEAMQQLLDNIISPIKAWAQINASRVIFRFQYDIAHDIAKFMWSISKALTTAGVAIGILTDWIGTTFFQPMITMSSGTLRPFVGIFFFIAVLLLGCSYLLAAFFRLNVVSSRNMILWMIAASLFFSIGPNLYQGMRDLTVALNSAFYGSALDTVVTETPFTRLAAGDPAAQDPMYDMAPVNSNFTNYIPGSAGKINGLDISLAFQKADGYDVLLEGDAWMGAAPLDDLPRAWYLVRGFFDEDMAPDVWVTAPTPTICPPDNPDCSLDEQVEAAVAGMQISANQAVGSIARELQAIPLVWFGLFEQLVVLCIAIAMGLTFISFSCAVIFAFFRRTEPIAWAVIDQWIALLVQTVMIALVQAMVVALCIAAGRSGSPMVTVAVSLVGIVLMILLLLSGIRAIWNSLNRLFLAVSNATGGVFNTPTSVAMGTMGAALAGGGIGLAGAGAMWNWLGQQQGTASDTSGTSGRVTQNPALDIPSVNYSQSASYPALPIPVSGNPDASSSALDIWQFPDNSRYARRRLGSSNFDSSAESESAVDTPINHASASYGPVGLLPAPLWNGTGLDAQSTNIDEVIRDDMRHAVDGNPSASSASSLESAAGRLEGAAAQAGAVLSNAAHALNRSAQSGEVQRQMQEVEGRLTQSGPVNVATVMGQAVDKIQAENSIGGKSGADYPAVSAAMADAMGIKPVTDSYGKPIEPVESGLSRFQLFADTAVTMGLSGHGAQQIIQEVKSTPENKLSEGTRENLGQFLHDSRGQSWDDTHKLTDRLEHYAGMVPEHITAYGIKDIPAHETGNERVILNSSPTNPVTFVPTPTINITANPGSPTPTSHTEGQTENQ